MKRTQSGSVLVISLVLLTTITLMAMMSLQRSGLQTKIVANILHKEENFHGAGAPQESWRSKFSNDSTQLLLKVIDSKDDNGDLSPLSLEVSRPQGPDFPLIVNATAKYLLPGGSDITLATGEEAGSHQVYRFNLDSEAFYRLRPNALSQQRSGLSFPGLTISKNSF